MFTTPLKSNRYVYTEVYSEPSQTSKMETFAKTVNGLKPLNILANRYILDVWLDYECTSSILPRMLESLAGCRTMFLFTVSCNIGELERNAY